MILALLKRHLYFLAILLFAIIAPQCLNAQATADFKPLITGNVKIFSKVLNEERKVYIYVPPADPVNPSKRYPVLYLMDGESHFALMTELCRYLGRWDVNVIPEMIIVGIPNVNRVRDLTPTHSIIDYYGKADTSASFWLKPSGGNEQFLRFIGSELMPYIETHYKTEPFKIFAGHSFGGISAVNCLLNSPEMFSAYIALSPSFWWDNGFLLKAADKQLQEGGPLNKILFYSDANEGAADKTDFHTNLLKFDSLLTKKKLTGLDYKYVNYPDDIHMTEPVSAYYDALRFIYRQWELPPQDQKKVDTGFIMNHYRKLSKRYGYTILPNETNINDWASYLIRNAETVDSAIKMLLMNIQNYPSSYKTYLTLGDAYTRRGEKQKAAECYKKAGDLKPDARSEPKKNRLKRGN